MTRTTLITAAAIAIATSFGSGCRHADVSSPGARYAALESPDEDDRRAAIKEMLQTGGAHPQEVPMVIEALKREPDPKNYGMMLLLLGKSGAPEAKPFIDANIENPNKFVRERAFAAREMWVKTHVNYAPAGPPAGAPQPPDTAGPQPDQGGEPPQLPPPPPGSPPPPQPPPGQDI
ncbi:MAG: HEAT repeat domain-containing protein [Polyangiaceae bacterium]